MWNEAPITLGGQDLQALAERWADQLLRVCDSPAAVVVETDFD